MKFVTGSCDAGIGLGNKMYQIASLYGIGRTLGRLPYFDGNTLNLQANLVEWADSFPNLACNLRVLTPKHAEHVDFGRGNYSDPSRLRNITSKYVHLSGTYLQSYKFFDAYRQGVLHLFEFGDSVKREVESYVAHRLPRNIGSRHKLCVHIRRGDFIGHRLLESKKETVEALVAYALEHIKKAQGKRHITAILLGTDDVFPKSLNFSALNPHDVHIHRALRRTSDLYFASRHCDSFVLTASGSTFAWWMAYLSGRATVFYNAQLTDDPAEMKTIADYDMFPEKWIRLSVRNGTAYHQPGLWGQ